MGRHIDDPALGWYVSGGQPVGADEPAGQSDPGGHRKPAGGTGTAVDAPLTQACPAAQGPPVSPPSLGDACAAPPLQKKPGAHGPVGVTSPGASQYAPGVHGAHSDAAARPLALEYVDAGHGHWPGAVVLAGQKKPAGHAAGVTAPAPQ